MNEQEQQLAIAQFLEPHHKWEIYEDVYAGSPTPYKKFVGFRYPAHSGWINAKDYLHDLNAMYDAFFKLNPVQMNRYGEVLTLVVGKALVPYFWSVIHATPAQRAEAFLKTIDRWSDDP